jgi:hypothetical protein
LFDRCLTGTLSFAKAPLVGIIFIGLLEYYSLGFWNYPFQLEVILSNQGSAIPRKEEVCIPLHSAIGVAV